MDIANSIEYALENYNSGNLKDAENICHRILEADPNNIIALNLLLTISYQSGDYDLIIYFSNKLILLTPDNFRPFHILGHSFQEKGLGEEAIKYYEKALELNPNSSDSCYNLGVIFQDKKEFDKAEQYYRKTLEINPQDVDACYNLAFILHDKKDFDEALNYYNKALFINSNLPDAYNNIGIIFQERNQYTEAKINFMKALELNPAISDAYINMGNVLLEEKSFNDAITWFQKALHLNPDDIKSLTGMGSALFNKEQFNDAINYYQKALQQNPNDEKTLISMGSALCNTDRFDGAITCFQKAILLKPDDTNILMHICEALRQKGDYNEALNCYNSVLKIDSDNTNAHYGRSFLLLQSGNFKQGWKEYEWRWKDKEYRAYSCFRTPDSLTQPAMNNLSIKGLTVLLYSEQGLGDEIQFVRYAPLVSELGAKVIVECNRNLFTLFQCVSGADKIIIQGEPLPKFDQQCPFLNLPLVFCTTINNIPSKVPYFSIHPSLKQKWHDKIGKDDSKLKIGLVWSGNPKYRNDRNRSVHLSLFSSLLELPHTVFYSLQKGTASEQINNLPLKTKLIDLTETVNDFRDTAALIQNLDLVISVDTAVAHLAGALGKPVWTLLPYVADWRWMLNREDTPWYPTMRLFRQPAPRDWSSAILRVKDELQKLINLYY